MRFFSVCVLLNTFDIVLDQYQVSAMLWVRIYIFTFFLIYIVLDPSVSQYDVARSIEP